MTTMRFCHALQARVWYAGERQQGKPRGARTFVLGSCKPLEVLALVRLQLLQHRHQLLLSRPEGVLLSLQPHPVQPVILCSKVAGERGRGCMSGLWALPGVGAAGRAGYPVTGLLACDGAAHVGRALPQAGELLTCSPLPGRCRRRLALVVPRWRRRLAITTASCLRPNSGVRKLHSGSSDKLVGGHQLS